MAPAPTSSTRYQCTGPAGGAAFEKHSDSDPTNWESNALMSERLSGGND